MNLNNSGLLLKIAALACCLCFALGAMAEDAKKPPAAAKTTTMTWCLRVNNAPNAVRAFGMDIRYPADKMTFQKAAKAELLKKGFAYFGTNEVFPGRVRIGGAAPGGCDIGKNAGGLLVSLTFSVKKDTRPAFEILALKDDMEHWSFSEKEDSQPAELSIVK